MATYEFVTGLNGELFVAATGISESGSDASGRQLGRLLTSPVVWPKFRFLKVVYGVSDVCEILMCRNLCAANGLWC